MHAEKLIKKRLIALRTQLAISGAAIVSLAALIPRVLASVYDGGGIKTGVGEAAQTGVSEAENLRTVIGNIVNEALTYVSLLAVTVIIIAGFYLILGLGSDTSKETAKKIILYVAVGLLVILLSKAFITLIKSLAIINA